MTLKLTLRRLAFVAASCLCPMTAIAEVSCVDPGSIVLFAVQQEGWEIGTLGPTVPEGGCYYDLQVTKDWSIRLTSEGPVRVTVEARGFKLEDPVRAFKAKATGTLRITIRPSVPGTGPAEFQLKMDLRKPGL
jgi:hypothetical protein